MTRSTIAFALPLLVSGQLDARAPSPLAPEDRPGETRILADADADADADAGPDSSSGSTTACRPSLVQGMHTTKRETIPVGAETYEWDWDLEPIASDRLASSSGIQQLLDPGTVLSGTSARVELTVVCDDACRPTFTCAPARCQETGQGAGRTAHMIARASIDAFRREESGVVIADANAATVTRGKESLSDTVRFQWTCE